MEATLSRRSILEPVVLTFRVTGSRPGPSFKKVVSGRTLYLRGGGRRGRREVGHKAWYIKPYFPLFSPAWYIKHGMDAYPQIGPYVRVKHRRYWKAASLCEV
jgi:hypothetical protein